MWKKIGIVIFAVFGIQFIAEAATSRWVDRLGHFKSAVVNIEISRQITIQDESSGTFYATGFIVDAKRGIVVTNEHVIGSSPASVKISFADGSFTEARPLYYDPSHDFGFLKINPAKIPFPLGELGLGSGRNVKTGDEVLLIGNNEREQYSIKYGTVANANVNKGKRYSSYIHTTFDRTGGSSGSPVLNTKGEVIAVHASGTDVSSFELIIDYVRDALFKIQQETPIRRGDIGVDLQLISIGDAIQYFHLPEEARSELKLLPDTVTKVIQVESVVPNSTSEDILRPGDIIYRVDGKLAEDDLYAFDLALDRNVEGIVSLDIFRHGKLINNRILVRDMELRKIRRFVRFAGAVFHDLTPHQRRELDFEGGGVYMSYAKRGSSFASLSSRRRSENYRIVISELNGRRIDTLDDFVAIARELSDEEYTSVVFRDFVFLNRAKRASGMQVILKYEPLEIYRYNTKTYAWARVN